MTPRLEGLVPRNQKDIVGVDAAHMAQISGGILHLEWSDVETFEGAFTFPPSPYGDLPFKIRLLGGKDSPAWIKNRVGTFTYYEPQSGRTGQAPNVWTDEYIDSYSRVAAALHAHYRDDPRLVGVEFGLGLYYLEPFIRGRNDQRNMDSLNDLGITRSVDRAAMLKLARRIRFAWSDEISIEMSFFPHQYQIDGSGRSDIDSTIEILTIMFDEGLIDACGPHDGRSPLDRFGNFRESYWNDVYAQGWPWYVQLAQPGEEFVGDPIAAAELSIVEYDAYCIELSRDWGTWAIDDLEHLNSLFPDEPVEPPEPVQTFRDVPPTHVFYRDVERIAELGITRGCNPPTNDLYCPDDVVTRGQMAAFLNRTLEIVEDWIEEALS